MCAEVYRKPRETIPSLIRRFSRAVQAGKILERAKAKLHSKKKPSERQVKQTAIMREALKELKRRLEKQGKYSDDLFQREKKKIKEKFGF
jgi:ribosomal protein S21